MARVILVLCAYIEHHYLLLADDVIGFLWEYVCIGQGYRKALGLPLNDPTLDVVNMNEVVRDQDRGCLLAAFA